MCAGWKFVRDCGLATRVGAWEISHRRDSANNSDVVGRPVKVENVADGNGKNGDCQGACSPDIHQLPAMQHRPFSPPVLMLPTMTQSECQRTCSSDVHNLPAMHGTGCHALL